MTTSPERKPLLDRAAFHPEPIRTFNESTLILFLTSILLGWLALPMVQGAVGAVLIFVGIAFLILLFRLIDQSAAVWVVIGIILGFAIDLGLHTSSSALGGDALLRAFFCLYLIFIV